MPKKIKVDGEETEVPDIPMMYEMSGDDYREYVQQDSILWLDRNDILRDRVTGRPVATTREQLDILIEELQKHRGRMKSKSS